MLVQNCDHPIRGKLGKDDTIVGSGSVAGIFMQCANDVTNTIFSYFLC
jgi:hypothetical protein